MNITFNTKDTGRKPEQTSGNHTNIDRSTTSHRSAFSAKAAGGGVALGISDTVMDNTAYGGHGRTAEDVMQEAGAIDVAARRDYMTVMSNSMSAEDFAKMQKDGFSPEDMDVEDVVTIVDHIKAAMIKGGNNVAGYTDDLDSATLEKMTGSKAFAQEIVKQFREYDIPVTKENVQEAMKAFDKVTDMKELSEGAVKYMVQNQMEPTIDNFYLAQFSGTSAAVQGRGYYADAAPGYYSQKAEQYDWEKLTPQVEKLIEEAGYEVDAAAIEDGKWLVEKGIPLTKEYYEALRQIREVNFPMSMEDTLKGITIAIAEGRSGVSADLSEEMSIHEKAVEYKEQTDEISDEAIAAVVERGKPLNLKNLLWAQKQIGIDSVTNVNSENNISSNSQFITGRRQLEEVRLSMTIQTNLKLLRSGFSIETAPMQDLIDKLKEAELAIQKQMTGEADAARASQKSELLSNTLNELEEIPRMPAALVGKIAFGENHNATLHKVHETGSLLKNQYEKVQETYEALMTAPRKDMGDSIQKAFRNVDDILEDMDFELTDSNRRAVRILGYNNMELTQENIQTVKAQDALLTETLEQMKPGAVLSMIRDGLNPLEMSLSDLKDYFTKQEGFSEESIDDYSHFLHNLDRKSEITAQERSAYIGVYRLVRQIEKGDRSAIGTLVDTGEELSFSNILKSIRTNKKQGMDVLVDNQFGGISAVSEQGTSISDQISQAADSIKKQAEEFLKTVSADEEDLSYAEDEINELRNIKETEDSVIRMLTENHQTVSVNNLIAAGAMMKYPGLYFKKTWQHAKEQGTQEDLEAAAEDLHESFTDEKSAKEAYGKLSNAVSKVLENEVYSKANSSIDVKNIGLLYKQISLAANLAKEEQYDVPVMIDGELSSIHLKVIHDNQAVPKVSASMWNSTYGKVAAEFEIRDKTLSGYIACDNQEGVEILKEGEEDFKNGLESIGLEGNSFHYIHTKQLDLNHFMRGSGNEASGEVKQGENKEDSKKVSTDKIYQAVKVFIGHIQKI